MAAKSFTVFLFLFLRSRRAGTARRSYLCTYIYVLSNRGGGVERDRDENKPRLGKFIQFFFSSRN